VAGCRIAASSYNRNCLCVYITSAFSMNGTGRAISVPTQQTRVLNQTVNSLLPADRQPIPQFLNPTDAFRLRFPQRSGVGPSSQIREMVGVVTRAMLCSVQTAVSSLGQSNSVSLSRFDPGERKASETAFIGFESSGTVCRERSSSTSHLIASIVRIGCSRTAIVSSAVVFISLHVHAEGPG
jgi:hypothetical protein